MAIFERLAPSGDAAAEEHGPGGAPPAVPPAAVPVSLTAATQMEVVWHSVSEVQQAVAAMNAAAGEGGEPVPVLG